MIRILETKEFRGSYYRAIDSAAGLRALIVSLGVIVENVALFQCGQTFIPVKVLSQSSIWYLSIQVPQNRGKQCCRIVLSFNNNNTILKVPKLLTQTRSLPSFFKIV